jgi:hypothetical protein
LSGRLESDWRMMKPVSWNHTLRVVAALGVVTSALGAPLRSADVPADPAWVLHLDFDALRPTSVGRRVLAEMEKPESQGKLAAFQTLFGIDPRKELHGLTLYSAGTAPDDGLLLLYADLDPERLTVLAKAAKDSQSAPYKSHVIYSWVDDKRHSTNGLPARTYAAIAGRRLVMFAQQEKRVAEALDVLDRAATNPSAAKALPSLGATGNGCFIEGFARKLQLPDSAPSAAVARVAKSLSLRIGETNRQVTATLSLEANDESLAKQAVTVVQSFLTLVRLQREKPEAGRLAEALSLKQNGVCVVATLDMSAAEVVALLMSDSDDKEQAKPEKN